MSADDPLSKYFLKPTITIDENETIGYTIREMVKQRYRRFPVINQANQPVGMITTTDILGVMYNNPDPSFLKELVKDHMTSKIVVANDHDTIRKSVKLMYNIGISGLPIIRDNKIEGMFTEKDAIVMDSVWEGVPDQPVSSDQGIGRPVNEDTIVTTEFTFWQVADKLVNLAQRQIMVKEPESNTYTSIITIMSLLKTVVDILTLSSEEGFDSLQTLKILKRVSSSPLFQRASPTVVSSCRLWMNSRGIEAFPLFLRGKPVKLITEKDILAYLAMNLD